MQQQPILRDLSAVKRRLPINASARSLGHSSGFDVNGELSARKNIPGIIGNVLFYIDFLAEDKNALTCCI